MEVTAALTINKSVQLYTQKGGERLCCNRIRGNCFNLKDNRVRLDFYNGNGEIVAEFIQRGNGCPIPGSMEGHFVQGSEQPHAVEGVPDHCRGIELKGL